MINEKHFMGRDGFYWFFGKVVDRNDTTGLGRVRVRVFGIHPDDENLVPNDHLPWAIPVQPVTSAGIFGVGHSATGLLPGSHVFGFFADGQDAQIPVVLGSIASSLGHYVMQATDTLTQTAENAATAAITSAEETLINLKAGPAKGFTKGPRGQLLDLIAQYESVPAGSYNSVIGGGSTSITTMTVNEAIAYGYKLRHTPGTVANRLNSSAMGRYQFVGETLKGYIKNGTISGSEKFDGATQDKLCLILMKESGADPYKFLTGKINAERCISRWATKWQSWPLGPNGNAIGNSNARWNWNELISLLNKIRDGK